MERENRKLFEDVDGTNLVWDVEDGTEEVYFEYEDGERDMLWSGASYKKAETVYQKTLEYMQ